MELTKKPIRNYFSQQQCNVCKGYAVLYRFSSKTGKGYMLCGSKECDYRNLIEIGYVSLFLNSDFENIYKIAKQNQ